MDESRRDRFRRRVFAAAIVALCFEGAAADTIIKTLDRKFPLSFCPLDLNGWQSAGSPVGLSFVAPSSSVRVSTVPPRVARFSSRTVRSPARARQVAATSPLWPAPTKMTSCSLMACRAEAP